ncbi:GLUG motif-containing protein [Litoribacter populi]|uniref:GLUG motif-containing protein n=1 Tax=Litoribacter populi TaxID=2598460 RepID=UPI00117D737E|nr:GLUG motif-containing protein [Litoribacter populi]
MLKYYKEIIKVKILCLILLISGLSLSAQTITQPLGNGTLGDPFRIENLEHLHWMAITPSSWDKHFEQGNDIDATNTENWNNGEGWIPVGWEVPFTGSYNGNGHAIKNLSLARNSFHNHIGLFAHIQGGSLKNLQLESVKMEGSSDDSQFFMGSLVGFANSASIQNCSASGTIQNNGGFGNVDKLIGHQMGGEMQDCTAEIQIIN